MTKPVDFLFIDGFLFPSLLSCFHNFLQKVCCKFTISSSMLYFFSISCGNKSIDKKLRSFPTDRILFLLNLFFFLLTSIWNNPVLGTSMSFCGVGGISTGTCDTWQHIFCMINDILAGNDILIEFIHFSKNFWSPCQKS